MTTKRRPRGGGALSNAWLASPALSSTFLSGARPRAGLTTGLLTTALAIAITVSADATADDAVQASVGGGTRVATTPGEASARLGAEASMDAGGDASRGDASGSEATTRGGLEGGLRTGISLPLGSAARGREGGTETRALRDLAPWRMPLWVDLGYRVSESTALGAYLQVGFGSSGDGCDGDCTWADIRIGAQGTFRLAPGADMDPWLGVGLGYESFTYRSLRLLPLTNPVSGETAPGEVRFAEQLGGPELMLQGGLDFQVDPSLMVGPYVSTTLGVYVRDGIKCSRDDIPCEGGTSVDGSGVHSWIGIGLRGAYNP